MNTLIKTIIMLLFVFPLMGETFDGENRNDTLIIPKISTQCKNYPELLDTVKAAKEITAVFLNKIDITNHQMDSIINSIVKYLDENTKTFFYITLMKKNDNIYIEIMGVLNNNSVFEFNDRGISDNNYLRQGTKIFGCLRRLNSDFYLLSYPPPYNIEDDDFEKLFQISDDVISLKKEGCEDVFIYENPMWLYVYENHNNIKLLKSINDKEFSTSKEN